MGLYSTGSPTGSTSSRPTGRAAVQSIHSSQNPGRSPESDPGVRHAHDESLSAAGPRGESRCRALLGRIELGSKKGDRRKQPPGFSVQRFRLPGTSQKSGTREVTRVTTYHEVAPSEVAQMRQRRWKGKLLEGLRIILLILGIVQALVMCILIAVSVAYSAATISPLLMIGFGLAASGALVSSFWIRPRVSRCQVDPSLRWIADSPFALTEISKWVPAPD